MARKRLFSLFFCLGASSLLMLIGCAKPIIKMPKPLPPIVKQYKHKTIHGNVASMQNTGVYLTEGDVYTILATGSIDIWPSGPRHHDIRPWGHRFIARIGKNSYFTPMITRQHGVTNITRESGKLYLGIRDGKVDPYGRPFNPEYYKDNIGSFSVDIRLLPMHVMMPPIRKTYFLPRRRPQKT
jgi:hypothetical protein